ncbi:unnamed protein product [Peniophora sp. CBMAI 1063]|nr:unnamed protein product [Peniophora sp. CBMAI 1063]
MSSPTESKLTVAICGGGIGGLMLAHALARGKDIAIDVYEGAAAFSEIGAGITLRKRTMPFLTELGLAEDINAISSRNESGSGLRFYRADRGKLETVTDIPQQGMITMHRAELHGICFRRLPNRVATHTNKRLVSYLDPLDADTPIRLVFADGTEATCDVLIGADGVKSVVRATMLEGLASRLPEDEGQRESLRERIPPRFSGAMTFRAIIPREKLSGLSPESPVLVTGNLYAGNHTAIVTYPISQGRFLNVAIMNFDYSLEGSLYPQPWVSLAEGEELAPLVDGWAPELRHIVACLDGLEVKKWIINVVQPSFDWSHGRVTLLGDAAHAMTPFQGAGAVQAIEDGQVLSALLAHPRTTRATVQRALRVYADVRRPVALDFFNASRRNGQLISDPTIPSHQVGAEMAAIIERVWDISDSPDMNARRAVHTFEDSMH